VGLPKNLAHLRKMKFIENANRMKERHGGISRLNEVHGDYSSLEPFLQVFWGGYIE